MQPTFAICLAAFSFSFYPLMNTFGTSYSDPITFSVINHIATILVAGIFMTTLFNGPKRSIAVLSHFKKLPMNVKLIAVFSGIAIYLGGLFFIMALQLMSRAGATVITEMWPALAVFIAPLLIRKNWQRIKLLDVWVLVICLVGVIFITAAETGQNFSAFIEMPFFMQQDYNFEHYLGIFLAVLSAYCFAFSGVSRAHFANSLPQDFRDEYMEGGVTIKEATYTYLITYILGIPLVILLYFVMETGVGFEAKALLPGVMNGIILTVTSTLYSYAILKSDNSNINILWYFAPLLASLWLILFGLTEATDMVAIGGFLIILANVSLIMSADKEKQATIPLESETLADDEAAAPKENI
jgi:drug/metabolite transporter (DMT)-like permease